MRCLHRILICGCLGLGCLMSTCSTALAAELFGEALYWQATEVADWTLNTNRSTTDQFIEYATLIHHFTPGFRVGAGVGDDCSAKLYYTRFRSDVRDSASGYLTPVFIGGKLAMPTSEDPPYFQEGAARGVIDYNVIDLELSKSFCSNRYWRWRPVFGLKGAWINQSIDLDFQGAWGTSWLRSTEHVENNFWGIGPKLGIENSLTLWSGEAPQQTSSSQSSGKWLLNLDLNFYVAYLLGNWSISDVTINTSELGSSRQRVPIDGRRYGAVTFQAMVGVTLKRGNWDLSVGYEMNDWLNQYQAFDDGTGPHNGDLILQGLNARLLHRF